MWSDARWCQNSLYRIEAKMTQHDDITFTPQMKYDMIYIEKTHDDITSHLHTYTWHSDVFVGINQHFECAWHTTTNQNEHQSNKRIIDGKVNWIIEGEEKKEDEEEKERFFGSLDCMYVHIHVHIHMHIHMHIHIHGPSSKGRKETLAVIWRMMNWISVWISFSVFWTGALWMCMCECMCMCTCTCTCMNISWSRTNKMNILPCFWICLVTLNVKLPSLDNLIGCCVCDHNNQFLHCLRHQPFYDITW